MRTLAQVRFFAQSEVCCGYVSHSRTLLQSCLFRYLHCATTRLVSDAKSVEQLGESNEVDDEKKKATSKKYIYYKGGKPKYSTGEPLSSRHVSRISNKHFFGPLLETKKERVTREKSEEKIPRGSSSDNLIMRIQETSKGKKKRNVRFDVNEYDKVAAVYSGFYNTSKKVKKSTLNNAQEELSNDSCNENTQDNTKTGFTRDASALRESSVTTSETKEHFLLAAQLQTTQTTGSDVVLMQSASSTSASIVEVENWKYVDVPRYCDLHHLHKFPLFMDNANPLQLPFNASHHSINSGAGTILKNVVEDIDTDLSTNNSVVSISFRSSGSKSLPSVSRILSETMPETSKIALAKWEAKMIAELGEQGFQDYKKELFSQGSLLHECIHGYLQHSQPPSDSALSRIQGFWRSVEPVLAEVRCGEDVAALESRVIHPHLHYAGVLDCVSVYRNTPVIVEWKTSTKPKRTLKSTYDNPLQLAAYLGAMQYDPAYRHLQVQSGLLAFAYSDGSSCDTHVLSRATLERYWRMWLARLSTFWKINSVSNTDRTEFVKK